MDRWQWVKFMAFGNKIIDIGCNEGLAFRGHPLAPRVTGVDMDLWEPPGYAKFVQCDAAEMPFADNEFDCAILGEILEHVPDPVKTLKEARRVAKCILFTTPNEFNWNPAYKPFMPLEQRLKEDGVTYEQRLAQDTTQRQYCKGVVDDKTKPHLWHIRYFDLDSLCETLEKAGLKYRIELLEYDGWSFFVGVVR